MAKAAPYWLIGFHFNIPLEQQLSPSFYIS